MWADSRSPQKVLYLALSTVDTTTPGVYSPSHANERAQPNIKALRGCTGEVFDVILTILSIPVERCSVANPDPQTMIDTLTATYETLAAEVAISRSMGGRSITMQRMEELRKQIVYWEQRRDGSTKRAFTIARPVR